MTIRAHLVNRGARIGRVGSLLDIASRALRFAHGFVGSDIMTAADVKAIAQAHNTVVGLAQRLDEAQLREARGKPKRRKAP